MVVAAIILAAKIIGGLADFIIGNVIDGSNLKGGKMRPFVFVSAFPLAILSTIWSFLFRFRQKPECTFTFRSLPYYGTWR